MEFKEVSYTITKFLFEALSSSLSQSVLLSTYRSKVRVKSTRGYPGREVGRIWEEEEGKEYNENILYEKIK